MKFSTNHSGDVRQLYDKNMYQFEIPQSSYWEATVDRLPSQGDELRSTECCDVAIIGGGYTGLSTAYHLTRDYGLDVRVLDAGHLGWGASGRNGGFCGIGGSKLSLEQQLARFGVDETRRYYQSQVDAVNLVGEIIRGESIDTVVQGSQELEVAHSSSAFESLRKHAEMQSSLLGLDSSVVSAEEFRQKYFDSTEQHGAALLRPTFGLHPLQFVCGLASAARRNGAALHFKSAVKSWHTESNAHYLTGEWGTLKADRVVMATNGFMPEHLHRQFIGVTLPVISAIIVTRPLTAGELEAYRWSTEDPAINSRKLFNYFRLLPDKRLLFGGRGHSTGTQSGARRIFTALRGQLIRQWPQWHDVDIDFQWHGLVCMTRRRTPCIGQFNDDPSVFFAFGYHGNGVNTAIWSGKQIANWLVQSKRSDSAVPKSLPIMVQGLSDPFPLPGLRLKYLRTAIAWRRVVDCFN